MKIIKNNLVCLIGVVLLAGSFTACKNNIFSPDGEKQYISKAELAATNIGKNRLKISFVVPNDQVTSAKVFWNNRQNSKDVPLALTSWPSTVNTIVGPLDEGDYTFEVILYSNNGNTSIPVKITGSSLGVKYESTLANRPIKDIFYDNNIATIYWGATGSEQQTEVTFTDINNVVRKIIAPFGKDTTQLVNFKPADLSTTIQYQTAYIPNGSIDTFYANPKTETVITGTLRALANDKKLYFGSLISYGGGDTHGVIFDGSPNGIYSQTCVEQFNLGQATWGPGRWKREGGSDFNDVNAVINWSRPRYDKVMAMLIVGPNTYMPAWFTTGTFTPTEMDVMLKNLITELMTSNDNKSKVDIWNVANELFNSDGTYQTMKWNDMGWEDDASGLTGTDKVNLKHPVFIGKAFQYCRQFTNALLELREHNFEFNTSASPYNYKHKAFYQLLKHLKAKGYPIDAAGIQGHYTIGTGMPGGYEPFKNTIKRIKDLGVDVYLTELDIGSSKVNAALVPWTASLAEQQKTDYYDITKAALEGGVNLISLWGARDDNTTGWRFGQNPLLLDVNYNKKPAYFGFQKALFEAKR